MSASKKQVSLFDRAILVPALADSLRKLHPRDLARNPVMFVVAAGSALTSVLAVRDIVRTWDDGLREEATEAGKDAAVTGIARRFPNSYRNSFSPAEALVDAERIAGLSEHNRIAIDYYRHADQKPSQAALKIYHHGNPVALSRRVPILENMGFSVISERTFEVGEEGVPPVFVHDMEIANPLGKAIDLAEGNALEQSHVRQRIADAALALLRT